MDTRLVFRLVALGFGVAAAFHALAVFAPIDPSSPRWRHALFVAINVGIAAGMLRRPRWFAWVFGVLVAQQAWSHGRAFIASAQAGSLDVNSIVVLIGLPIVLVVLLADRKRGNSF